MEELPGAIRRGGNADKILSGCAAKIEAMTNRA
jgi:hypothetical protein